MENQTEQKKKSWNTGIWLTLVGVTIAICVLLIIYWKYLTQFEFIIYLGLFFTAILAGSPIPIPTPCFALTFTLGSKFEPLIIGAIAGTGAAIGSMLVYYTARTGRHFWPNLNISDPANKIYSSKLGIFLRKIKVPNLVALINKRGMVGIFLFSIFPNPLLMPLLITMGISKYHAWKVAIAAWTGNCVMFMAIALIGHYGLGSILRLFGVFKIP